MDFGLSRRPERNIKTRTNSTLLNETDVILAGPNQPGPGACYSSPNSTNIAEMDFTSHCAKGNTSKQNVTINQSMETSQNISIGRNNEIIDAQIKAKVAYLNQLKSIDLKKYSFPNENKPKTDYTYAKTSSYVSTSKTDECPMPNLCRRSRISPPSNRLINFPFSSRSPNNIDNARDYLITKSEERLSFFHHVKSYFRQTTTTINASTSKESLNNSSETFKQPTTNMIYTTSKTSIRPNLNIGPFLDEADTTQTFLRKTNSQNTNENSSNKNSYSRMFFKFLIWSFVIFLFALLTMFALQQYEAKKELDFNEKTFEEFKVFFEKDIADPFMIYSSKISLRIWAELNLLIETSGVYLNNAIKDFKDWLDSSFITLKEYLTEQWKIYWPKTCELCYQVYLSFLANAKDFYQMVKNTLNATANIVNTVEYKLPTFMHHSFSEESDTEKKEIIKDYVLLKEKIFSEAMEIVKNSLEKSDIETMRKELDQKFNYTLSIMANKLIDQSMQIEISKANHEKELNQMKDVLNELETRYKNSMEQLQEKLNAQTNKLEEQNHQLNNQQNQNSESILNNPKLQEELKTLIQSSHVDISFQKIEEYINKTFYLYNADKTGMTDFASEAVGGSILFTRCTEVYTENSRWFTVFDVPISRLTVSPRVVIQGTVQPGNCWGFKGDKGDLFIKLAAKITPTSFSLEHIPKELSLTGRIDSAPQNFTVYGYSNVNEINDDKRYLLGNFRYDNESKSTLQFFEVQNTYTNTPIRVIELKIESNAGNKDYTCLYKFRVHGKLFELMEADKKTIDAAQP